MSGEIILTDSDSNTLEYIEITNAALGTYDAACDMLVICDYNPAVPIVSPYEIVANKRCDLLTPNNVTYPTTLAVSNALSYKPDTSIIISGITNAGGGIGLYSSISNNVATFKTLVALSSITMSVSGNTICIGTTNNFNDYLLTTTFNTYTGNTSILIGTKLNTTTFNAYTGDTKVILDSTIITANNGLTKSGQNVKLGGSLTGATTIETGVNAFKVVSGNTIGLVIDQGTISLGDYSDMQISYIVNNVTAKENILYQEDADISSKICQQSDCLELRVDDNSVEAFSSIRQQLDYIGLTVNNGDNGDISVSSRICQQPDYVGFMVDDTTNASSSNIDMHSLGIYMYGCLSGIHILTGGTYLYGNTGFRGAQYCADYSPDFTLRSLVDAAYVTGLTTTSGIQTANNGLTKSGTNVRLGGALTGATTIDGCNGLHSLSLNCLNVFNFGFKNGATISDYGTNGGIKYAADYSGSYVTRSLVDKGYVDNKVISGVLACNGLTKVGSTTILGGTLTGDTSIIYGASSLCFKDGVLNCIDILSTCTKIHVQNCSLCLQACNATCNGQICMSCDGIISLSTNAANCGIVISSPSTGAIYNANYSAGFLPRSLVDKGYVTGLTSAISNNYVCSANNGLTKSGTGTNVRLGGALTGDTIISGAYTLSLCSDAKLNTACGYQISGTTMFRTAVSTLTSIYIGQTAGSATGAGTNNFGAGSCALGLISTGSNDVAIGNQASYCNTSGCNNIAMGLCALRNNSTGSNNIAQGYQTLMCNVCGGGNIAQGYQTLMCNVCGGGNIAQGEFAMLQNTIGCNNIAQGYVAMYSNVQGCNNVAIGDYALFYNNANWNIAIGCEALFNNQLGQSNVGIGNNALCSMSSGIENIGLGRYALSCNIAGNYNIGIGSALGYNNGSNNIGLGNGASNNNTIGNMIISIGDCAGFSNITGCSNIFIGRCAGYYEMGSDKLHIGNHTGCTLISGDFVTNTVTLPTLCLCTAPAVGICTDSVLVWNSTDMSIKKVPYFSGSTAPVGSKQITGLTLSSGSWTTDGVLKRIVLSNANIYCNSIVEVIPNNSTISIVKAAEILPEIVSNSGSICIWAMNYPSADISITINITQKI